MEAAYVYRLAGTLGSELQRLSDRFGTASLAGLVPQVVRLLELLETLAAAGTPPGPLPGAPSDEEYPGAAAEYSRQVAEQRLAEAQERERRLQSRLTQLEEEQQRALSCLAPGQAQEEGPGRRERELMLQLKEVVDHQRDKIRAQDHEIQRKAQDMEALQEQLNRFMTVNENLRQKVAVVQAQLRSALEKKAEAEALWEAERRGRAAGPARTSTPTEQEEGDVGEAAAPPEHPPDPRTFSKEELQQILQERNELKTSLFLVEEELAYYQRSVPGARLFGFFAETVLAICRCLLTAREMIQEAASVPETGPGELLNGERVPALHAVKSAIKKQRKKIWAKMLGTEEEPAGREEDEEEEGEGWPIGSPGADHTDGRLPESKIKSFFSQWYRRSSQPSPTESRPGTWEVISAEDVGLGEEEREEVPPRGSSSPSPTSPLP